MYLLIPIATNTTAAPARSSSSSASRAAPRTPTRSRHSRRAAPPPPPPPARQGRSARLRKIAGLHQRLAALYEDNAKEAEEEEDKE